MKLKKINLRGISDILSEKELKNVLGGSGGVTQTEYCCSLVCIGSWNELDPDAFNGAAVGWSTNCKGFDVSVCISQCSCGCTCDCV